MHNTLNLIIARGYIVTCIDIFKSIHSIVIYYTHILIYSCGLVFLCNILLFYISQYLINSTLYSEL